MRCSLLCLGDPTQVSLQPGNGLGEPAAWQKGPGEPAAWQKGLGDPAAWPSCTQASTEHLGSYPSQEATAPVTGWRAALGLLSLGSNRTACELLAACQQCTGV